jgi:hypothetical protein
MKKLLLVGGALIALGLLAACTVPTPKVVKETVVVEKEVVKEVEKLVEIVVTPTRPTEALESAQLATAEAQISELQAQLALARATMTAIAAEAKERPTATATTVVPTLTPTPAVLAVGDTAVITALDCAVTLHDVRVTDEAPNRYGQLEKAPTGFNYIILDLGMTYLGESIQAIKYSSTIHDRDGDKYIDDWMRYFPSDHPTYAYLPRGYEVRWQDIFQVPVTAGGFRLRVYGYGGEDVWFDIERRTTNPQPIRVPPDTNVLRELGAEMLLECNGRPLARFTFGNLRSPSEKGPSQPDRVLDSTITNLGKNYFSSWPGIVHTMDAEGRFTRPFSWHDKFYYGASIPPGQTVTVEALPLYFYEGGAAPGKKVLLYPGSDCSIDGLPYVLLQIESE